MHELLTTRQVQSILKVDRTTIYRMLREGRLNGVKLGNQWRFPEAEVRKLIQPASAPKAATGRTAHQSTPLSGSIDGADPYIKHIQSLQDVLARLGDVGAVTTDLDGVPCTSISNSRKFCNMILDTQTGRADCIASWQALAWLPQKQTQFHRCHAGLCCARAFVEVAAYPALMLVVGQLLQSEPAAAERDAYLNRLAREHGLDRDALRAAVQAIPLLSEDQAEELQLLLAEASATLEQIGKERADLLNRLRQHAPVRGMTGARKESRSKAGMAAAE